MQPIRYEHVFHYPFDTRGARVPALKLRVGSPHALDLGVDVFAVLDTGADRSIFMGDLAPAIGLDLLSGRRQQFRSAAGFSMPAMLHKVRLSHEVVLPLDLEVAFSTGGLLRNLLGRDFFELFQVGFRERRMEFYLARE